MNMKAVVRRLRNNHFVVIVAGTALILLIPFVAMWFTDEVNWNVADFIVAGGLLIGTGLLYETISRKVLPSRRVYVAAVLMVCLGIIWADLAVGIFGLPFSGS